MLSSGKAASCWLYKHFFPICVCVSVLVTAVSALAEACPCPPEAAKLREMATEEGYKAQVGGVQGGIQGLGLGANQLGQLIHLGSEGGLGWGGSCRVFLCCVLCDGHRGGVQGTGGWWPDFHLERG
jgi:hypothetical protein